MTKDEIFKKTLDEKNKSRNLKILESQEYLKSCYFVDDILKLSNKLGNLKIDIAKRELNGASCEDLLTEKNEVKKQLLIALKSNGKDIDKIMPNYTCKKCNDKGYLDNGDVCECLLNDYKNNLIKEIGVDVSSVPTLDEINLSIYNNQEEYANIINTLKKIYNSKYNTLLFTGGTGTGKTYISKSFLKTLASNLKLCRYYSSVELNRLFLKSNYDFKLYDNLMNELLESDLVVIDDLGSESTNKTITADKFLYLLNERQARNKLTLITTNLTLNDIILKYTERFFSRLMDKNICLKFNFSGKDLRLN